MFETPIKSEILEDVHQLEKIGSSPKSVGN